LFAIEKIDRANKMKTTHLLFTGSLTAIVFWLSTIIAGFIHGNYNHFTNTVSELGALGTQSQTFMMVTITICGLLSLMFMVGLYRACKLLGASTVPVYTVISMPVMFFWVSAFPAGTKLHATLGSVILLLYAGMLIAVFVWRGRQYLQIRVLSAISFLMLAALFLRMVPSIDNTYPGLIQRIAHLGWSVWLVSLNISFVQLLNLKNLKFSK
jgi:hypothetical membrane protein